MVLRSLLIGALILLVSMTLAFLIALKRRRLDTVDIAWGLGFIALAWSVETEYPTSRSLLIALLVSVWGLRLAAHIGRRALSRPGDDPRYLALSSKWAKHIWLRAYFSVFILQGALILLISLPVILAIARPLPHLAWLSMLGLGLWLIGFALEAASDYQLNKFLQNKDHPKVMQNGLWHYSRHPNYFGEITQWWGIGIIASGVSYGWLGLAGPLSLSLLIIFISGIPPIEKRRQGDPQYQAYKARTSPLVPWFPGKT
jgi:steroid 5-alpha reductase family enzyme